MFARGVERPNILVVGRQELKFVSRLTSHPTPGSSSKFALLFGGSVSLFRPTGSADQALGAASLSTLSRSPGLGRGSPMRGSGRAGRVGRENAHPRARPYAFLATLQGEP
jgi:hypothetical protein